jgi:hypothetical protein
MVKNVALVLVNNFLFTLCSDHKALPLRLF